jgi:hypothetical protein
LEDTIMAEDKQEWPVTDGAPLNPYDVDTSKMRDPKDDEDGADADAAMPKGDHVEDRDAMSVPAADLAGAAPGPGGTPSGVTTADTGPEDDEKPKRRSK